MRVSNSLFDGFAPADEVTAEAEGDLDVWGDSYDSLAEHHTADGKHSFFLLHDSLATWGIPGEPQLISLQIIRDLQARTFRIDQARQPTVPFAQRWLINRGCPSQAIQLPQGEHIVPADTLTSHLEDQIRSSGDRYDIEDHFTCDWRVPPYETWVMVHDRHPGSTDLPVRIFLEASDLTTFTYTLREGAFRDSSSARTWLCDRDAPLPAPPKHLTSANRRARAALARCITGPHRDGIASTPAALAPAAGEHTRRGIR
ncbi:hypothetical protein [Streptomyces hygroscopicus]|uniref:hypothetical protein n=1 Tax=Streptomyces hygroscopicus TaxID=1912 RepID=UPI000766EA2B|nr:hypothetical protein [Streptomyces hygroscopicus]